MKLIVMVPCLNEEATLPSVIKSIPESIPGVDRLETLIVDDGSTDRTLAVARELGVNHVVKFKHHMGLANAFQAGIDACLDAGADIIVNTDGDNQYPSASIPALIGPILNGEADVVIGDRQTNTIKEFSVFKRFLQRAGSFVVRTLAGTPDVKDAVSGFRAYTRQAASRIYLTSSYSYTLETLIQAGKRGLRVHSVPIQTNPKTRPSRLSRGSLRFVARSGLTIIRSYTMYEPLQTFLIMGSLSFLAGMALGGRFVYYWVSSDGSGHVQSLILAAILMAGGLLFAVLGMLADLIATNRRLLEELLWREKAARQGLLGSTSENGIKNGLPSDQVGTTRL